MKKIAGVFVVCFLLSWSVFVPGVFARDLAAEIIGENGILSVPLRLVGEAGGRGIKFVHSLLGGDYYRDYGDTGYRHGGSAYENDYGGYGDGNNGYGYNHQGVDGNDYTGV